MAARRGIRIREIPVRMLASPRASTLHGGTRTLYYVYKMLLSIWAVSGSRRREKPEPPATPLVPETKEDAP